MGRIPGDQFRRQHARIHLGGAEAGDSGLEQGEFDALLHCVRSRRPDQAARFRGHNFGDGHHKGEPMHHRGRVFKRHLDFPLLASAAFTKTELQHHLAGLTRSHRAPLRPRLRAATIRLHLHDANRFCSTVGERERHHLVFLFRRRLKRLRRLRPHHVRPGHQPGSQEQQQPPAHSHHAAVYSTPSPESTSNPSVIRPMTLRTVNA